MTTIPEEDLVDVPIIHEEPPVKGPLSPTRQSAPVPTFEFGITLADPATVWALFRMLHIQHDVMSALCEHVGFPRPSARPFQLGPDPGPSRPPWSFFPPAGPFAAEPSTAPPVAATDPTRSPGSSSTDHSLTEQLMAILDVPSPPPASAPGIAEPTPSPTSVLEAALATFDPDSDDLLDDY